MNHSFISTSYDEWWSRMNSDRIDFLCRDAINRHLYIEHSIPTHSWSSLLYIYETRLFYKWNLYLHTYVYSVVELFSYILIFIYNLPRCQPIKECAVSDNDTPHAYWYVGKPVYRLPWNTLLAIIMNLKTCPTNGLVQLFPTVQE
mgnify:CR=1 FL=1